MKELRVLVITTSFYRWQGDNTEPSVSQLCGRLATKGYKIFVLAPHDKNAQQKEVLDGVTVYRFPYFWPKKWQRLCYGSGILPNLKKNRWLLLQVPLLFLSQLAHAVRINRKENIDFIHSHWVIPSGLTAWCVKKLLKTPYIASVHGSDIFPMKKWYLKRLLKTALAGCDISTTNSNATASAVLEIVKIDHKLEIIPMGINLNVFRPGNSSTVIKAKGKVSEPTILTVGRLIAWKGINYLLEAMPLIMQQFSQARLVICGDGSERRNLEELARQLAITDNVSFEGNVPNKDMANYYKNASVFVIPSIIGAGGETEALGVVLLEAMACGTPIVASNVGGIPSTIEDSWNGLLAEQKNPRDLACKIVKLLSNKELSQRFSEHGLQRVRERFSWEVVVEKFGDVYERLR